MLSDVVSLVVVNKPAVIPHLKSGFYKTYEFFDATLRRMITSVYNGNMGGDFVDALAALIRGQTTQAYLQAWEDDGQTSFILPDYLQTALDEFINTHTNFDWIYQFYKDIVDARVDGTPLAPLLARSAMWATRYNDAYTQATALIVEHNGGKLMWKLGATEQHCASCAALDGIVAYASEWNLAGCKPQGAPNDALECGGWQCDCSLEPTDKRRSKNAFDEIMKRRK